MTTGSQKTEPQVWEIEHECYCLGFDTPRLWYEAMKTASGIRVVPIVPEDDLSTDEYMRYVLSDAKRVSLDDVPTWVRSTWEE